MAEKEYTIRVTAESDTSQLEDLQALLEQLSTEADNTSESLSNMDSTGLNDIGTESENASQSMQDLDSAAQSANESVSNMDSSAVKDVGESAEQSSSSLSEMGAITSGIAAVGLAGAMEEAVSYADNYNVQIGALTNRFGSFGVSAGQLTASIQSVTDATSISGSQARSFFLTMSNYGVTNTNALSQAMTTLYGQAALGGVSFDQASSAMQRMVASGNVSARVVTQLGTSIDTLSSNLGMTNEEFKQAFSDATPEQRLQMLTAAMGDTTAGIELMNGTAQASMAEVQQSFDLALRNIGEALLPVVVAGLQAALPLVQGFAAAMGNPVFAAVAGGFLMTATSLLALGSALKIASLAFEGLSAGVTAARTGIALVSAAYDLLTGKTTLNTLATATNTEGNVVNSAVQKAAAAALAVKNGVMSVATTIYSALTSSTIAHTAAEYASTAATAAKNAVMSAATGVYGLLTGLVTAVTSSTIAQTIATTAQTVATGALTVAQTALNAVMAMNPFILVAMAVIALVAALWYLYNTNEQVRAAIDGFMSVLGMVGEQIWNLCQTAINALMPVVQFYITAWTMIGQAIYTFVVTAYTYIVQFVSIVSVGFQTVWSIMQSVVSFILGVVIGAWNSLKGAVNTVATILRGTLNPAISLINSVLGILSSAINTAVSAWNSFKSAVQGVLSPLQNVYNWIQKIINGGMDTLISMLNQIPGVNITAGDASEMSSTVTVDPNYKTNNELRQELEALQLQLQNNTPNNAQNVTNGDIIINIDTVDSEERIQKLVDELTKALKFNNTMAGRTV